MSDERVSDEKLQRYRQMRDFNKTDEPSGHGDAQTSGTTFVVQKHAATRLHYDVRFEVDGVMPSWAVPKGPSYDPAVKRLAVHVEDHPLDYQTFEGNIPKGEYGGGAVIVWDNGTYDNRSELDGHLISMRDAITKGHVTVHFHGTKLNGEWSLIRTKSAQPNQDSWIMVKRKDEFADASLDIATSEPNSVLTNRSVEDVAREATSAQTKRSIGEAAKFTAPMLAEASKAKLPVGEWVFERKLDGLRCVAVRSGNQVKLWSRNQLDFTPRFGSIVDALLEVAATDFVIDGELVAFDKQGRTSFSLLQQRDQTADSAFCVFDLVHLLGRDTTVLPLLDRKRLLGQMLATVDGEMPGGLQLVEDFQGEPGALLKDACAKGWEGLIAKRPNATYKSGRSPDWRKLKCTASQELVIGGWTEPKGTRAGFGALLVGYYDETRSFRYAGKVGTGFDHSQLREMRHAMQSEEQADSSFIDPVAEKNAHWCRPHLVAQISFIEWTPDGKLRHPVFQGLRPDKAAFDVVREPLG